MVIEPEGEICSCGNVGCFESRASGRAIINNVYNLLRENKKSMLHECCHGNFYRITPELVYTTAMGGDILARGIFRDLGKYLGIGIANLINIFGPEAVIIGGGLSGAWDLFIDELKRELPRRTLKPLLKNVQILRSQLEHNGGALGAAGLVFEKYG
jgi:glucokinase